MLKPIVQQMRAYTQKQIAIDDTGNAVSQMLPPEHLCNSIVPSTEESRMQSMSESSEQLTDVSQQDLRGNKSILTSGPNLQTSTESI